MSARFYYLPALLAASVIIGCSHTNNLARYDVVGKTAIYRASTNAGAASSHVMVESPDDNAVAGVASAIGSVIAGEEGRHKLERAINGDSIAQAVARGIRQATGDYLRLSAVESMADNPDFIIETEVTHYSLVSTTAGMCVHVSGNSRMIDRRTGGIVWENSESHSIPLSETWLAMAGPRLVRSGLGIFNAVQLLSLSEEEIRQVVNEGAAGAGREIGEQLREDVAEMHGR